jgi:predicted transcriptional regulator
MAKKLSASKISKIIEYKNAGYSQHYTASKLHINQSTVSHYWNQFDLTSATEGLEVATEMFGGGDATEINAFAAELKEEHLSLPEAKAGFKVHELFQKLEVDFEHYEHIIKACLKLEETGFLDTAVELVELEEALGKSGLDVIADLKTVEKKRQEAQAEIDQLYPLIKNTKKEIKGLEEQKKATGNDLAQYMKHCGMTVYRLKLVESLSMALMKAGVSDYAISSYLQRHAVLDDAGLDVSLFANIVTQSKMVTAVDGGQALLSSLVEYGGLKEANAALSVKQKVLTESVAGLEAQAELKGELAADIATLSVEKVALEPYVKKLQSDKDDYQLLQAKIGELEQGCLKAMEQSKQRLQERLELESSIDALTEKTGDLITKGNQVIQLNQEIAELEEMKKRRQSEWQSFLGFVGLICEQPLQGLETFSQLLPLLVESVKKGTYKAVTLRNHVVQTLTGTTFDLPMCCACPHIVVQPITRPEIFVPTSSLTSLAVSLLYNRLAPPVEKPAIPVSVQHRKIKIIAIEPLLLLQPGTPSTASEESPAG